jgi:hypothetical protein
MSTHKDLSQKLEALEKEYDARVSRGVRLKFLLEFCFESVGITTLKKFMTMKRNSRWNSRSSVSSWVIPCLPHYPSVTGFDHELGFWIICV